MLPPATVLVRDAPSADDHGGDRDAHTLLTQESGVASTRSLATKLLRVLLAFLSSVIPSAGWGRLANADGEVAPQTQKKEVWGKPA
jgi:hypothetical protein